MTNKNEDELVFLPLGGCGEIGMNLSLLGLGPRKKHQYIMVDLGVTFGDSRTPGVDLIMGDPDYIEKRKDQLLGLVLTHGHEDHIGAVAQLWPRLRCPIYATPFTAELVNAKLAEVGLLGEAEVTVVPLGGRVELGPFDIEYVTLTHSTLEPNALAIRTPLGTVLHTGDWKLDPDPMVGEVTDEEYLRKLGDEGVLAMLCDSTNVFNAGSAGSEGDVRKSLTELIGTLENRVAITGFASNIARVESVIHAATANDRHVALVGRSMHRYSEAAKRVGYLKDIPNLISDEDAGFLPKDKVVYLCTGSQGEPRAALGRIAEGDHPAVTLEEGDTVVFSSRVIPGNDVGIYDLQNRLAEQGIEIITDREHFVHVSGHPCRDELATMYAWVRPHIAVPVHGEARHLLEHAQFARSLQVPEAHVARNGSMLRLAPGDAEIVEQVDHGRLYLDGDLLVGSDDPGMRLRKRMAVSGQVIVTVVLDKAGDMLADAVIRLAGVPQETLSRDPDFVGTLQSAAEDAVEGLSNKRAKDDIAVEEAVRRAVRAPIRKVWGKKPLLDIQVIRTD